jgi:5'-nucleotidase
LIFPIYPIIPKKQGKILLVPSGFSGRKVVWIKIKSVRKTAGGKTTGNGENQVTRKQYLLTNDDGIFAEGLMALYEELSRDADCLVVAPEAEQSGTGHAITLFRPVMVRKFRKNGKKIGYAVSGTPADCVKLGIRELADRPVDLVVSGINAGANIGVNVIYSGTVSAAMEGLIMGLPSLAVSLNAIKDGDFTIAARFARKAARLLTGENSLAQMALNINVPDLPENEIKGVALARQGRARFMEAYDKRTDPRGNTYYWLTGDTRPSDREDDNSDICLLSKGMITVTPISCDLTCAEAIEKLRQGDRIFDRLADLLRE